MAKKWVWKDSSESVLTQIIANRNLSTVEVTGSLQDLPKEELLKDMDIAGERIVSALQQREKIVIFGHDDPDGVTSAYVLWRFLYEAGCQNHATFIPNRSFEPHGIQQGLIQFIKQGLYTLCITVDNGIVSFDGAEQIKAIGCDLIITDHHLLKDGLLPTAVAVVDHKRPDSLYPDQTTAGVGLSLLLCRYLSRLLATPVPPVLFFWTAVGTIADRMPMRGVNRLLVKHAIATYPTIQDENVSMLQNLLHAKEYKWSPMTVFQQAIQLLSIGREEAGNHLAMSWLQAPDTDSKLAYLQKLNQSKIDNASGIEQTKRAVDSLLQNHHHYGVVHLVTDEPIPFTMLGLAASHAAAKLGQPVLFLIEHNGVYACEARCSDGFHLPMMFQALSEHLIQFGGHVRAAGFSMKPEEFKVFQQKAYAYILERKEEIESSQVITADAVVDYHELLCCSLQELGSLAPFGQDFQEPVLLIKNCPIPNPPCSEWDINNTPHSDNPVIGFAMAQWQQESVFKLLDHKQTL